MDFCGPCVVCLCRLPNEHLSVSTGECELFHLRGYHNLIPSRVPPLCECSLSVIQLVITVLVLLQIVPVSVLCFTFSPNAQHMLGLFSDCPFANISACATKACLNSTQPYCSVSVSSFACSFHFYPSTWVLCVCVCDSDVMLTTRTMVALETDVLLTPQRERTTNRRKTATALNAYESHL